MYEISLFYKYLYLRDMATYNLKDNNLKCLANAGIVVMYRLNTWLFYSCMSYYNLPIRYKHIRITTHVQSCLLLWFGYKMFKTEMLI